MFNYAELFAHSRMLNCFFVLYVSLAPGMVSGLFEFDFYDKLPFNTFRHVTVLVELSNNRQMSTTLLK